eukprot:scaffold18470_cov29-Tisochrysis_lutea.AAC.3
MFETCRYSCGVCGVNFKKECQRDPNMSPAAVKGTVDAVFQEALVKYAKVRRSSRQVPGAARDCVGFIGQGILEFDERPPSVRQPVQYVTHASVRCLRKHSSRT